MWKMVTFESNGGTSIAEQIITEGSKITIPENPKKMDMLLLAGIWMKPAQLPGFFMEQLKMI